MARIHGNKGQLAIDPAGATAYTTVASINAWTLDMTRARVDVTSFGDTNVQRVQGLPDFSGTFGGFWDSTTTPTAVFDVVLGDVAVGIKLVPSSLEPTFFFSGLGYIDGAIQNSATGAVTISGSFVAASNWTQAP